MPQLPPIHKPFNSASLWATEKEELRALYKSPHTGAITTRTACSVDGGFQHDDRIHQHTFFKTFANDDSAVKDGSYSSYGRQKTCPVEIFENASTLNTLGYSQYSLKSYIQSIREIQEQHTGRHKPVIFSVAGSWSDLVAYYVLIASSYDPTSRPYETWAMEINMSCPNIPGHSPPAYSGVEFQRMLCELSEGIKDTILRENAKLRKSGLSSDEIKSRLAAYNIPIGLKLPPFTYPNQFDVVVNIIRQANSDFADLISEDRTNRFPKFMAATPKAAQVAHDTINPSLLQAADTSNIDTSLVQDLMTRLTVDEALSQAPSMTRMGELWRTLTPPFPIAFLTSTNTLGSCLHLSPTELDGVDDPSSQKWTKTLSSADETGIGGLGGAALHPLALGNVKNLKMRLMLDEDTRDVQIVGVGGVSDIHGYHRMKAAGADAVALATALGAQGYEIFARISDKLSSG